MLLLALLSLAPAHGATKASRPPLTTELFYAMRAPGSELGSLSTSRPDGLDTLLAPADLPASARSREGKGSVSVVVGVDTAGAVTRCTPPDATALATLLCTRLRKTTLPVAYSAPGQAVAADWLFMATWQIFAKPEIRYAAPPAPPLRRWPLPYAPMSLRVGPLPEPPALPPGIKDGSVVLLAKVTSTDPKPECEIAVPSLQPVLDALACQWAEKVRFTYARTCIDCFDDDRFPFKLVVRGGKAMALAPRLDRLEGSEPVAPPMVFDAKDLRIITRTPLRPPTAHVRVIVGANGKGLSCANLAALAPDIQEVVCRKTETMRFTPAIDMFGEPVAGPIELTVPLP